MHSTPASTTPAARRDAPSRRVESLAMKTLLSVARQRKDLDHGRCRLVFEHLDAALAMRTALHRTLSAHRLSELQFGVLVTLFALDPEPVMPADLADYSAVSRAAITDALARLESMHLVSRARAETDRRMCHLRLTEKGRITVEAAMTQYLAAIGKIARHVAPETQPDLLAAYQRLQCGAAELAS